MKLSSDNRERLSFLARVVEKEIKHLDYAVQQAFNPSLTLEQVRDLDNNPELSLKLEAFSSRFSRLQDTLGDKLLPALLKALGESENALLVNLDKAEKFGWLESAEQWIILRQLRNQMVHEYIEDPQVLFDALTSAKENIEFIRRFADSLLKQISIILA
jgi:hypothetical protein